MAKRKKMKDPFFQREAKKYGKPIPSREFILDYLDKIAEPMTYDELVEVLALKDEEELEALHRRLLAMVRDGQLIKMRSGKFGLVEKLDLVHGVVIGHADGHGFLVSDEGGPDLFIPPRQMRMVFDGDTILGRVTRMDHRGRGEAMIVRVLKRKHEQIVGRFLIEGGVGFVVPDNKRISHDIIIPEAERNNAQPGEIVIAAITAPPTLRTQAVGKIVEILGHEMAPGLETDISIRAYDLPHVWSEEVVQETATLPKEVQAKELTAERKDLRDLPFVTIDGEDARDFDDAVYCHRRGKTGWTLYVAIADVSHYVKSNTALDQEAVRRGNSVYFPTRVIPMLPEALSNGLCSLNENVDRLALVCQMNINNTGKMGSYQFYPAVIRSKARLTYNKVAAMLVDNDVTLQNQYKNLMPHLTELYKLYQAVHAYRLSLGTITFEVSEPKFIFDEHKKIKSLIPLVRNDAHKLIEECMLCANVAAAQFLLKNKQPALYRVHQGPKTEKLPELLIFLGELGIGLSGGLTPAPKDYARVLEMVQDRPDSHLVQTILLRSLSQANYNTKNQGHFGLAFDAYTHFTSPIRRYPDLLVHRAIYAVLNKQKATDKEKSALENAAVHCSMTERRADEATRQVVSWLKCEFMLDKVGFEFDGVISGVTGFGLFIELRDIFVEGLVHISTLENDYYHFDAVRHRLTGQRTGKVYCIGDTVKIRVLRVNLEQRQVDFEILQDGRKSSKKINKKTDKKNSKKPKKKTSGKKTKAKKAKKIDKKA